MDSSLTAEQRRVPVEKQPSDEEILARRISAGDSEAWERFFDHYFPWTYRFAYQHLGGNRADAEDLCSDILMTAAKCIKQFNGTRGTLDVWLLGIARHRLAHFCRSRRLDLPLVPEVEDAHTNPETPLGDTLTEGALTRDIVNRALASLPERQAAALIGKYVSGHTVEEMARSAGSTPKTIESLLARGRAAFRIAFRALLQDSPGGRKNG